MIIARLIDLVLRVTDLIEAEGRAFRASITELVIAALVFTLAGALGVLACVALTGALVLALWTLVPLPVALGLVGVLLALVAALVGMAGRRLAKPPSRRIRR